jgi:gas vesicle protein
MKERSMIILGALAGAAVGSAVGYLFLTERGRRLRQEFEPKLDDLLQDVARLRDTVDRARTAASEGWRAISDVAAQRTNWSDTEQTAPF